MVESLAAGTPVLAFANGDAPEIVKDGATGFLAHDVAEMAQHARQVGDLDRAACRAAVDGPFSTRRMVRGHLRVYGQVITAQATGREARNDRQPRLRAP